MRPHPNTSVHIGRLVLTHPAANAFTFSDSTCTVTERGTEFATIAITFAGA